MKNLLNFFFSFDKLFKEKLIVPFFWLALVYYSLKYLVQVVDTVQLDPLLWIIGPLTFFSKVALTLIVIRIVAELAVAIFRINDNLSPDGGKSELAEIDPVAEARKAAELAAARTREATKSMRENVGEMSESVSDKAKAATASVREKTGMDKAADEKARVENIMGKGSVPNPKDDPTPVKILEPSAPKKRGRPAGSKNKAKTTAAKPAATKIAPKKRGRPAGSKNKTTTAKTTKPKTAGKRGPKPGTKVPRDADGNLLKKDGTPRKKPGPKKT